MPKTKSENADEIQRYWADLRQKSCDRNHNFRHRNVNGTLEIVNYVDSDSSVTLWVNAEPGEYPLHWHSTLEIIMPIFCDYTATVGRETYTLHESDIMVIPPGELHNLHAAPKGMRLILLINLDALSKFRGFSGLLSFLSRPFLITAENSPAIHAEEIATLREICENYVDVGQFSEPAVMSLLIRFLVTLARSEQKCDSSLLPSMQPNKQREYVEKFNTIYEYIEHNYTEDISLEDVASLIGFSKFHFSRLFHQFTGTSFYDYLSLRRLKAAESLLLNPSLPITEIALQSGFSSISTFNRVFKKYKQCTPTEFKEFGTSSPKNVHR